MDRKTQEIFITGYIIGHQKKDQPGFRKEFPDQATSYPGIDTNAVRRRLLKSNALASTQTPVKEDSTLEFSSPSLKEKIELLLDSKARRQMIVDKATAAGYSIIWQGRLDDKCITNGDLLALGAGTSARNSMPKVENDNKK